MAYFFKSQENRISEAERVAKSYQKGKTVARVQAAIFFAVFFFIYEGFREELHRLQSEQAKKALNIKISQYQLKARSTTPA